MIRWPLVVVTVIKGRFKLNFHIVPSYFVFLKLDFLVRISTLLQA